MSKIVSANLDKISEKIYKKIDKIRPHGWFSKDVQLMLQNKYSSEKKVLVEELIDLQKKRDELELEIKAKARKINSIKDEDSK